MSMLIYIASDASLEEVQNPHSKTVSVNEALEIGMSVPKFMLEDGFDRDAPGTLLWSDTEIIIDTINNTVNDGGLDDDFFIRALGKTSDILTDKRFCVELEWVYYT